MIKSFVITVAAVVAAGVFAQAQTSPASGPTDPQIAMIVVTADNVDIAGGKLAADAWERRTNERLHFARQSFGDLPGVDFPSPTG